MSNCTTTITISGDCTSGRRPASNNAPPSKLPPWARQPLAATAQYLYVAGTIDVQTEETYLSATLADYPDPIAVALPNGRAIGDRKVIKIPGDKLATTAGWLLTGTFAKYASLTFDGVGFNAELSWDGTAWHFLAGNATTNLT